MRHQIVFGTLAFSVIATQALAQGAGATPTSYRAARAIFAAPITAMAPAATAPTQTAAPKKWTITSGADFPSLYIFRGIVQEYDSGFTMQPFVDAGTAVSDKLSVNFGTWNSFQSGTSGSDNPLANGAWYESDLYISATVTSGRLKFGPLWTSYTSPNDAYKAVQELAGVFTYDDSNQKVPFSPKAVLAFELSDAQADGGAHKGVYLELGVKPAVKPGGSSVTVAFPVKLGLSLKDYYEVNGEDNTFGYFQFGGNVSVPISALAAPALEIHGGVDFYCFPENRKVALAGDDELKSVKPVFNIGFSFTF